MLFIVVYVPFLQPIFTTTSLSLGQLGIAVGLGLVPLFFGELAKWVK